MILYFFITLKFKSRMIMQNVYKDENPHILLHQIIIIIIIIINNHILNKISHIWYYFFLKIMQLKWHSLKFQIRNTSLSFTCYHFSYYLLFLLILKLIYICYFINCFSPRNFFKLYRILAIIIAIKYSLLNKNIIREVSQSKNNY